jgi:hypothetical protein
MLTYEKSWKAKDINKIIIIKATKHKINYNLKGLERILHKKVIKRVFWATLYRKSTLRFCRVKYILTVFISTAVK